MAVQLSQEPILSKFAVSGNPWGSFPEEVKFTENRFLQFLIFLIILIKVSDNDNNNNNRLIFLEIINVKIKSGYFVQTWI